MEEETANIEDSDQDRSDISSDVADVILNAIIMEYEQIFNDKRDLDQKTGVILAGIGIIIGFVATRGITPIPVLLIAGVLILLASSLACVYELIIHTYHGIDADGFFDVMIERQNLHKPIKTKLSLVADLKDHIQFNRGVFEQLTLSLYIATITFVIGVVFIVFSYMWR